MRQMQANTIVIIRNPNARELAGIQQAFYTMKQEYRIIQTYQEAEEEEGTGRLLTEGLHHGM